jgi:hypothetical protein
MQKVIGNILVELSVDTILIKDANTNELIRAKVINASDAVETYTNLIKTLTEKHINKLANV